MSVAGHPDGCGCCGGVQPAAPRAIDNRPSLPAIAYRIGTHGTFKESALSALSSSLHPELRSLQTRRDDDFAIALLDAWAVVADILTFYQERIANEAYLRTATERISLVGLSRLIGYQLAPGVAAATPLAFTLDDNPTSPSEVVLDVGTKVQSIPGPGETPQTFETIEAVTARPPWSAMEAQTSETRGASAGDTSITLDGISTGLKVGDAIGFVNPGGTSELQLVTAISTDTTLNTTLVSWLIPLSDSYSLLLAFDFRGQLFGANAPQWYAMSKTFRQDYVDAVGGDGKEWTGFTMSSISGLSGSMVVDGYQSTIKVGGYVALVACLTTGIYEISLAVPQAQSNFALSNKTTFVGVGSGDLSPFEHLVRETVVYGASRELTLGGQPINEPLLLDKLELATGQPAFPPGRTVIVTGKQMGVEATAATTGTELDGKTSYAIATGDIFVAYAASSYGVDTITYNLVDRAGVQFQLLDLVSNPKVKWIPAPDFSPTVSESALVDSLITTDPLHTVLVLDVSLGNHYDRTTVVISGNVARATHGETFSELLGDGNAAVPFQTFTLKQSPVTYVSAPTAEGAASTLVLRVNDVQWTEVPALYQRGMRERVFVTTRDDSEVTTARFGDGISGARLPSGSSNVRATYRKGLGVSGNVAANAISLLLSRPLGLRGVNNPLPATGGQDAQTVDGARENAPVTVMTLGLAVSLSDYQSFARVFAGVGKALATWSWNGRARAVFLTIAGPEGAEIPDDSDTHVNLIQALTDSGDPNVPLRAQSFRPVTFKLALKVRVDPTYDPKVVLPAVEHALRDAFSFDARDFGQAVSLSSVYEVVQSVAGVVAARVDALYRTGDTSAPNARLAAALPEPGSQIGTMLAAELLTLDPAPLDALDLITDGEAP